MTKNKVITTNNKPKIRLLNKYSLYMMLIPATIFIIVFYYIPMGGIVIAFQDYQPINGFLGSPFVGFKWLKVVLDIPDILQVVYNTIYISLAKIVLGLFISVVFALLLNEIRVGAYKKSIQTFVYLPHFLSWVIIGGIFRELLSQNGMVNRIFKAVGIGSIFFLGSNTLFRPTMVILDIWKSFGFGAIIYLAALSGVNVELYESAALDGANRFQQTLVVTLPAILPTIILVATLNMGNILNAGFEQILMFYNPAVYRTGDIIDTFVYRSGLIDTQYSVATMVGFVKSLVGFILITLSYKLAKKYANYTIF